MQEKPPPIVERKLRGFLRRLLYPFFLFPLSPSLVTPVTPAESLENVGRKKEAK